MKKLLLSFVLCFMSFLTISAQEGTQQSIDELNRQLENPLSRFWSLILQENIAFNTGNLVDGTQVSNVLNFQPSLPVPVGKGKMLIARPVFPFLTVPKFNGQGEVEGTTTGFGDMQIFSLVGPDKKDGLIWGAGLTFVFPTASSTNLGNGKYQTGPALMLLSLTEKWTIGGIVQHWETYAGNNERPDIRRTELQYITRRQIRGKGMSIGMGPNITFDWNASKGNRVTFPIGLGITKTVKWGKTPWKLRIEPQYAIVKPNDYGAQWNLRIQIAPIIRNPFF